MKEFSTFADGYDCRDCISCEKEVVKLKNVLEKVLDLIESGSEYDSIHAYILQKTSVGRSRAFDKFGREE